MLHEQSYFKVGFTGADDDALTKAVVTHVGSAGAKSVVIPFAGSGKTTAELLKLGCQIHSWDTQECSNVFHQTLAQPWTTRIKGPYGMKGFAYQGFPFPELDEGTAQVINYIAIKGTIHDRAALAKSIIRSTLMARLSVWSIKVDDYQMFYRTFERDLEYMHRWAGIGQNLLSHTKGSFFEGVVPAACDVIYIDPPKVLTRTDLYSGKGFRGLNGILEQQQVYQPEWTKEVYIENLRKALASTDWKMALAVHCSGVLPELPEVMQALFSGRATLEHYEHGPRVDYLMVAHKG